MTEKTDVAFLLALLILTLVGLAISSIAHAEDALPQFICSDQNDANCGARSSACEEGDCDRADMEHWSTHYLAPPPGKVCHNSDVSEALDSIGQHRRGWLLAGWGRVASQKASA